MPLNKKGNWIDTRKKVGLVSQDYAKIEVVDFDEAPSRITYLEAIRQLHGLFCLLKFKLYQMDVKSSFLNSYLEVEVSLNASNDLNNIYDVILEDNGIIMIVQIYVDYIVFGRI